MGLRELVDKGRLLYSGGLCYGRVHVLHLFHIYLAGCTGCTYFIYIWPGAQLYWIPVISLISRYLTHFPFAYI